MLPKWAAEHSELPDLMSPTWMTRRTAGSALMALTSVGKRVVALANGAYGTSPITAYVREPLSSPPCRPARMEELEVGASLEQLAARMPSTTGSVKSERVRCIGGTPGWKVKDGPERMALSCYDKIIALSLVRHDSYCIFTPLTPPHAVSEWEAPM